MQGVYRGDDLRDQVVIFAYHAKLKNEWGGCNLQGFQFSCRTCRLKPHTWRAVKQATREASSFGKQPRYFAAAPHPMFSRRHVAIFAQEPSVEPDVEYAPFSVSVRTADPGNWWLSTPYQRRLLRISPSISRPRRGAKGSLRPSQAS